MFFLKMFSFYCVGALMIGIVSRFCEHGMEINGRAQMSLVTLSVTSFEWVSEGMNEWMNEGAKDCSNDIYFISDLLAVCRAATLNTGEIV